MRNYKTSIYFATIIDSRKILEGYVFMEFIKGLLKLEEKTISVMVVDALKIWVFLCMTYPFISSKVEKVFSDQIFILHVFYDIRI